MAACGSVACSFGTISPRSDLLDELLQGPVKNDVVVVVVVHVYFIGLLRARELGLAGQGSGIKS